MKKKSEEATKYVPRKTTCAFAVRRSSAGLGLFAETMILRDTFVIEYYGILCTRDEADKRGGKYLFEVSSRRVIDGSPRYNKARYLNHSCKPNCETDVVRGKVYIYAKRNIQPGEELTYDYGKEYFDDFIKPIGCRCQACLTD